MIRLLSEGDSFKSVFDRNGTKIHISEQALIINHGNFLKCQVIGFSKNYNYVYLVSGEVLYKRKPSNIVLIYNLFSWEKH